VIVNPGQSISVTLTFNPQATGSATGLFTVTSNATSTPTISIALSGTGNPHRVDLSWTSPNSSTDPVVSYNIYRSVHGSNSFGRLNAGANTLAAYSDSTVQSGISYDYYVKSVDSAGAESVASNTTAVSIP
jgi:fibronectin type 3 domain-containing protein